MPDEVDWPTHRIEHRVGSSYGSAVTLCLVWSVDEAEFELAADTINFLNPLLLLNDRKDLVCMRTAKLSITHKLN